MTTIKKIYKNETYTLTLRGKDLAYAIDEKGCPVTNSIIYQALTFLIN